VAAISLSRPYIRSLRLVSSVEPFPRQGAAGPYLPIPVPQAQPFVPCKARNGLVATGVASRADKAAFPNLRKILPAACDGLMPRGLQEKPSYPGVGRKILAYTVMNVLTNVSDVLDPLAMRLGFAGQHWLAACCKRGCLGNYIRFNSTRRSESPDNSLTFQPSYV
jgi:hypothetical protein